MKYIIGHQKPDLDATVAPIALKYLYSQADCFNHQDATVVLPQEANTETTTVFEKFNVKLPQTLNIVKDNDQFILVDHNEESQRHPDISNDQIIEIVDHHKVAINIATPIYITVKPWGSSSTIVAWLMKENKVTPEEKLASIMISAILSDTVGLKSATTTQKDKEMLQWLNQIAKIQDLDDLTLEIFKAKSNISDLTPEQIVTNDYKIFDFSGNKVLINQIETVEQDKVLAQKADLLKAMESVKKDQSLDYIFCAVTDILKVNTKMLYLSPSSGDPVDRHPQQILEKGFDTKGQNNIIDIGAMMSRKKEFAPAVEGALAK